MAQSSTDVVETRASLREEMAGGDLGDDRLNARRDRLINVLEQSPATGFPEACASDGDVEALYRFLRNPRVSLRAVLEPHLAATQARCRALDEVLVIHDTTECSFAGAQVRAGLTPLGPRRQGFWVHAALAVSAEGLRAPFLGLLSVMPFVRKSAPVRRPKPPWRERFRDPDKLSRRWPASVTAARARVGGARRAIHLMDREGDSYELLATMATHGDRFVVRLHYDRRVVPDETATAPSRLREALPRTDVRIEREVALSPRRVNAQRTPLLTRQPPRDRSPCNGPAIIAPLSRLRSRSTSCMRGRSTRPSGSRRSSGGWSPPSPSRPPPRSCRSWTGTAPGGSSKSSLSV